MANRDLHTAEAQAKRDRTVAAESKIKQLRAENFELRRQVFRAQETARLADEEAHALRQHNVQLLADVVQWRDEAHLQRDQFNALTAPRPSLLQRLTGKAP